MSGRLSSKDHRLHSHSNMPAVITMKVYLHKDPTKIFLASMLILSPTYTTHEKYETESLHLIIVHKYKTM
jgi:hypothetical protein